MYTFKWVLFTLFILPIDFHCSCITAYAIFFFKNSEINKNLDYVVLKSLLTIVTKTVHYDL